MAHLSKDVISKRNPDQNICNTAIQSGLIVLLAFVVYFPILKSDFVSIDDPVLITKNPILRTAEGLKAIWLDPRSQPLYCPIVSTAFWIQYHLWGLQPAGYHITNILFHAASAIVLLLILMRLSVPGAWLASLIFLIHPLQVESVAWVAELKNILSGFFSLISVWIFFRFNPPDEKQSEPGSHIFYAIALFLFFCALLSKPTASTVAPALLLVYWWKRGRIIPQDILYIAPMFILGVMMGLLAIWIESSLNIMEGLNAGNQGSNNISIIERVLIAGHAIWFYVSKIFWPVHLTCFYSRWKINPTALSQYFYPITAIIVIVSLWLRRNKIGRGPITAVLIFAGVLAPFLGFIDYSTMWYSFATDHFQYMACIGLIVLASASGVELFGKFGQNLERIGQTSATLVILSLSLLSFKQGNFYKHSENLLINNIKISPDSPVAQANIGLSYYQKGQLDKAISYYREAIRLWPGYGEAQNNLGIALMTEGKLEDAAPYFYESLKTNPKKAMVHFNLGYTLAQMGKLDDALVEFNAGLALEPQSAEARYNLGNVYLLKGNLDAAIQQYMEALRIKPNYAYASESLSYALAKKNEIQRSQ